LVITRDAIAADVVALYDTATTFAETVTGPAGEVAGIFSAEYRELDAGGYVVSAASEPMLRTQDGDAMETGDVVVIRGSAYQVVEVRPGGYGETVHRLQSK
jgi:hypothetical protein